VFAQVRDVSHQQCPCKKTSHLANVIFGAHVISQPCRHTTSEAFRKGYAMYCITRGGQTTAREGIFCGPQAVTRT